MKLIIAAMLRQFAKQSGARYSYTFDELNPGNWIVWDGVNSDAIYEENTKSEAIAITALLNMGFPYQYSAMEGIVEEAVNILNDESVSIMLDNAGDAQRRGSAGRCHTLELAQDL